MTLGTLKSATRRLLRLAIAVWACTAALALAGQRYLVFPAYLVRVPADWSWNGVERVAVATADGETLKGYWRPPAPGAPVVVSFHGNAAYPEPHAERFAAPPWSTAGWGMLAVAYRGYPGSTGSPSEAGLLADGEAALAFVEARAPGAGLLLHGHSLGSGVAVALAARHPAKGLYLEAPYSSVLAVARHRAPLLPTALLRDTFRSDERIGAVRARTVLVHGDADPVIPDRFGRELAGAARPGVASFLSVRGDHFSIFGEADEAQEPLFRAAPALPPGDGPGR